jgi:ATP-dependent Clp protease ATP-binding subunit ClpC
MYERFTFHSRQALQKEAQRQAQLRGQECVETEHLLLGLMHEGGGAAIVLKTFNVDLPIIEQAVNQPVQPKPALGDTTRSLPTSRQVKKVIEYSMEEARGLHHNYIGTEHLLLGLLRDQQYAAAAAILKVGLDMVAVRERTIEYSARGRECGDTEGCRLSDELSD